MAPKRLNVKIPSNRINYNDREGHGHTNNNGQCSGSPKVGTSQSNIHKSEKSKGKKVYSRRQTTGNSRNSINSTNEDLKRLETNLLQRMNDITSRQQVLEIVLERIEREAESTKHVVNFVMQYLNTVLQGIIQVQLNMHYLATGRHNDVNINNNENVNNIEDNDNDADVDAANKNSADESNKHDTDNESENDNENENDNRNQNNSINISMFTSVNQETFARNSATPSVSSSEANTSPNNTIFIQQSSANQVESEILQSGNENASDPESENCSDENEIDVDVVNDIDIENQDQIQNQERRSMQEEQEEQDEILENSDNREGQIPSGSGSEIEEEFHDQDEEMNSNIFDVKVQIERAKVAEYVDENQGQYQNQDQGYEFKQDSNENNVNVDVNLDTNSNSNSNDSILLNPTSIEFEDVGVPAISPGREEHDLNSSNERIQQYKTYSQAKKTQNTAGVGRYCEFCNKSFVHVHNFIKHQKNVPKYCQKKRAKMAKKGNVSKVLRFYNNTDHGFQPQSVQHLATYNMSNNEYSTGNRPYQGF